MQVKWHPIFNNNQWRSQQKYHSQINIQPIRNACQANKKFIGLPNALRSSSFPLNETSDISVKAQKNCTMRVQIKGTPYCLAGLKSASAHQMHHFGQGWREWIFVAFEFFSNNVLSACRFNTALSSKCQGFLSLPPNAFDTLGRWNRTSGLCKVTLL